VNTIHRSGSHHHSNGRALIRAHAVRAKLAGLFNAAFVLGLFGFGCGIATASLISDFRLLTSRTWGDVTREAFLALGAMFTGAMATGGLWWLGKFLLASTRIILYFRDKPTDGQRSDEFVLRGGFALAKTIAELDHVAVAAGVRPFSTFGFVGYRRKPVWHDASDGLRTVAALVADAASVPQSTCASAANDLEAVRRLLERAAVQGTPFTLVVRPGEDHWQSLPHFDGWPGYYW